MLGAADFPTLHLPLTAETGRSIDAGAFAKMRDGVRLVNAARGELLDEAALVEALQSGKVAAAALDVFDDEPYTGPLLEIDNVVVTPHLAASTEEAQDRAGVIVAEQVVAALRGCTRHERGQHPVDRRGGPRCSGPSSHLRRAWDAWRWRWPEGGPSESSSLTTAPSPATTPGS